ncbi:fibrinogen-like protein 1-like protein [Heterodontus francisci]|uniref:fibrinogen-like protein 1-like protein n=1 Tax=Heterodontus francisci TaxID=7792 RepID=UPI00355AF364
MFSHRTLSLLVVAVFVVEKCSAITPAFINLLKKIDNKDALTEDQKQNILNARPNELEKVHLHRDCTAINRFKDMPSGLYVIQPKGSNPLVVYCHMEAKGDGWSVLQRISKSGSTSFKKGWSEYERTFGDLEHDHWLGNKYIHLITQQTHYQVKFVINSPTGEVEIDYASFNVEGANNKYRLRLGSPIGNSETYDHLIADKNESSDNMMFSTEDSDNDTDKKRNCAREAEGGWWYSQCSSVQLNNHSIHWPGICNDCTSATILIKPSFENCK